MSIDTIFDRLCWQVEMTYPDFEARMRAGVPREFPGPRARAYCVNTEIPLIVYAPKLAREPEARIKGVLCHELGHAFAFLAGRENHSERDADRIAEQLFGVHIKYDADLIQNVDHGVRPRPANLPNPGACCTFLPR